MSLITSKISQSTALFFSFGNIGRLLIEPSSSAFQVRNYAARKGTRERKQKKKVKAAVVEKVGFIPHNVRKKEKLLALRPKLKYDDSWKKEPTDNVYFSKYYKWNIYPFQEAVQCHRETHHPDIYNVPKSDLHARIELYMQGEKKTRFVDNFTRIVAIPYKFDHGEERSVIAFSKSKDIQQEALNAGAQLVGGSDLIKQIQNGAVSLQDFQFVIAHPDILPELVALRGLMKKRFPNPKNGSLDVDLAAVTAKFLNGIKYTAAKDEHEKDFGLVDTVIGTLDMDLKHLEENFAALINDVFSMKPKREGHFISRCLLWSPPSSEKFKVDHNAYLDVKDSKAKNDVEEEEGERVAL